MALTHSPTKALTSSGGSLAPRAMEPTTSGNITVTGCSSSSGLKAPLGMAPANRVPQEGQNRAPSGRVGVPQEGQAEFLVEVTVTPPRAYQAAGSTQAHRMGPPSWTQEIRSLSATISRPNKAVTPPIRIAAK